MGTITCKVLFLHNNIMIPISLEVEKKKYRLMPKEHEYWHNSAKRKDIKLQIIHCSSIWYHAGVNSNRAFIQNRTAKVDNNFTVHEYKVTS